MEPLIATLDDISNCFRLILGREPNTEEVLGHFAQAGMPLTDVVASYLNSAEFAQRQLLRAQDARRIVCADFLGLEVFVDADDHLIGRHIAAGVYEPEIQQTLRSLLRPGMTFLDVGANLGAHSFLASGIVGNAGRVIAIEPGARNVQLLAMTKAKNSLDNIEIYMVAADETFRLLQFHSSYSNGTTSIVHSNSALEHGPLVQGVPIDKITDDRKIDVFKIDIEGFEPLALKGAVKMLEKWHPAIISEFAPTAMQGGPEEYFAYLTGLGYRLRAIKKDGSVDGGDCSLNDLLTTFHERGSDHIDILAITPDRFFD